MMLQTVLVGSTVGLGVAALVVDTGMMFGAKQELQNAADSAALAAASQLGASADPTCAAATEGATFAAKNKIAGLGANLNITTDVVFGHAVMNGEKFDFMPNEQPYDAVQITLRRDATVADGPVSLLFSRSFGVEGVNLHASATAMLVPRDIAVVIDLSGSMNDDSELRHYKQFNSESDGSTKPGVQVNTQEIWLALPIAKGNAGVGNGLDPPPPGNPNNQNDQPGTGPGHPANAGGNPNPGADPGGDIPRGPRFGWMTGWGQPIILGSYTPVGDEGLYYIPRNAACTSADVIANLTEAGYYPNERAALLSGQYDSNSTLYSNRVKVILGVAGWKSKQKVNGQAASKYSGGSGNGDNKVDSGELCHQAAMNFGGGSWSDYINYVSGSNQMISTDTHFKYRYGLKTFTNYLLENRGLHSQTPELAATPEEPLGSVKNAVQAMIDTIVELDTQDHVSLEIFAQYGGHAHDLTVPPSPEELAAALQEIPAALNGYQASHETSVTNIGAGFQEAMTELTSTRARTSAAKVVILLTDGKPNVNSSNTYVGDNNAQAIGWAEDSASELREMGATIYTIGVGGDVNAQLCLDLAGASERYFFADNTPDPEHNGQPMYVTQLQQIFETLGGKRPVRLIR
jgi:hypothetical protein